MFKLALCEYIQEIDAALNVDSFCFVQIDCDFFHFKFFIACKENAMILWRESYHMTRPLGHCIESAQRRRMCCCARELFFVLHTDKETHKHTRKRRFVCLCIRVLMTSHIQLRTVNLLCILLVILWRSPMAKHDTNKTVYRCLYVHSFMYVCSAQFEEEYTRLCGILEL